MCTRCCRRFGGCTIHNPAAADDAAPPPAGGGSQAHAANGGGAAQAAAEDVANAARPDVQAADLGPPAWAQALLALPAQLQLLQSQMAAMQSRQSQQPPLQPPAQPPAQQPAPHPAPQPSLPPMPQPAAPLPLAQQPQQQQAASAAGAPHLLAFGVQPQVAPATHIHSHTVASGSGSSAVTYLLSNVTGGLAPTLPGQDGPSLEDLIARTTKHWKPYTSDNDMKEALDGLLQKQYMLLEQCSNASEARQLRAVIEHIQTTRDYVAEYGHRLAHKYHKQVLTAMNHQPPYYDPARDGSTFTLAFVEHLANARTASKQPARQPFRSTSSKPPTTSQPKPTKRSRSEGTCDIHPNAAHSNDECLQQHPDKRPATGKK